MKKISIVALIGFVLILILAFLLTQLKGLDFMEQPIINIDTNKTQLHFIHWINFPDVVFKAFEKENPNIIVEYEKLDGADYSNLIRAKLVSHNDIDLFGIKANDYSEFVTSGYLENLTYKDYVEAFEPTVNEGVKNMVFNHVQYAVSYNTCSYGVWYNESIFERNGLEIPKSYEAFLEICYQFKAVGINPIVMGGRDDKSMRVIYLLSDLFASESTTFKEELKNGTAHWTDESIMDAITKADKFIDKEFIMKESIYLTYQQAFQEF
ncbi:MAG: carbohydrate ABC transporter substrate-binding protein, partial [Vallitaleaceae bacterium]|nr:carbohydrate ABC transporter substrate-binding protein [Vallitaleaceae bacterium]